MSVHGTGSSARVSLIRGEHPQGGRELDLALSTMAPQGANFLILVDGESRRILAHIGVASGEAARIAESSLAVGVAEPHALGSFWSRLDGGDGRLLHICDGEWPATTLLIGFGGGPASDEGRLESLGALIAMALARCATLDKLAETERRRSEALLKVLAQTRSGLILLDPDRKLCFANAVAQRLLAASDGIRLARDSIAATTIASGALLQAALDHVEGSAEQAGRAPAAVLTLERGRGRRPLTVGLTLLSREGHAGEPSIAIHLMQHDEDIAELLAPICQLYRLSPVEGRLAAHLAAGLSLAEASAEMKVKHQTVRTYLRQVFSKTGTHRQSDLIKLLVTSIPPVDLRHAQAAVL